MASSTQEQTVGLAQPITVPYRLPIGQPAVPVTFTPEWIEELLADCGHEVHVSVCLRLSVLFASPRNTKSKENQ